MTTQNRERPIIDLRQCDKKELLAVSRLLMHLSALVSCQGLKLQIKKTRLPVLSKTS